jgi:hypothetical protein
MYKAGKKRKSKQRRIAFWCFVLLALIALGGVAFIRIRDALQPKTTISSSRSVVTKVTYKSQNHHYEEGDFTIDLPAEWQPVARPVGPYQSYTWRTAKHDSDGQIIVVYEDAYPVNFSVNRVLIVHGESDHVSVEGSVSDNCSTYTRGVSAAPGQIGAPAKWQGVSFLCDQTNQNRDVIGTSSLDGINTVILRSPRDGQAHKFLFTYTDYAINPDYTVFYNVLNSFKMQ